VSYIEKRPLVEQVVEALVRPVFYRLLKAGQAPVPFITGTTEDEGSIFATRITINTIALLRTLLILAYGATAADEIITLYEVNTDADAERAYEEILTDSFVAGARRTARMHVSAGNPAYLYQFTRSLPWMDLLGLGAFHGCEIVYVFGNQSPDKGYTAVDDQISAEVMGYWTRFAGTGNPNGAGAFAWPAYNATDDEHLIIDEVISVGSNLRKVYCDYFDSLLD
jgi:para-nitrobenzyl esterase